MSYRYKSIITLFLLLLGSTITSAQDKSLVQVLVGNEGNFMAGNATITQYSVSSGIASDGVFAASNGVGIGDVVQSLAWIDGKIFAVINNSQKIVVLNPETFAQVGVINFAQGTSPREMVQVSDNKAYVTSLYGGCAYIVDLNDYSVSESTIPLGVNPDKIIANNGFAYVANNGFGADSTIFKIDTSTDAVVDTFIVNRGPASMAISGDELWVVAKGYGGDYDENWNLIDGTAKPGGLHGINLNTGAEIAFTELESAGEDLGFDAEDGLLFIHAGGIRAFDINEKTLAADTLINGYFYGFGYDEVSKQFFTTDAKDYSSAGAVTIFDEGGTQRGEFSTGIIPGSVLFVYSDMLSTHIEEGEAATAFVLEQNYPNPFNPTTNIEFTLTETGSINLQVFNVSGQLVATLAEGVYSYGSHQITFNGSGLSSGVYVYRLKTKSGVVVKKMLLTK